MPYFSSVKLKPDFALVQNPEILRRVVKEACGVGEYVWRLQESINDFTLMIASESKPDFSELLDGIKLTPDTVPESGEVSGLLNAIQAGDKFKITVKANPARCARVNGVKKRIGITNVNECIEWLIRQGTNNGFAAANVLVCDINRLRFSTEVVETDDGTRLSPRGKDVSFVSVYFVADVTITDPDAFRRVLFSGIGREKAYGQGLIVHKEV